MIKKIAWIVRVPVGSKVLVKNGSEVREGEVVYESNHGQLVKVPLLGWSGLSLPEKEKVRTKIIKRKLAQGEEIWSKGWFSKKELRSPLSGVAVEIDEFGNMVFQKEEIERYKAPISAKKVRVSKEKIVFELKGWEKAAEGISQVKAWCDFDRVMIMEGAEVVVAKAEALGAGGIILVGSQIEPEWSESGIPIVKMEKKEVADLVKLAKNEQKSKLWINPISGKVLLVLE